MNDEVVQEKINNFYSIIGKGDTGKISEFGAGKTAGFRFVS